MTVRIAVAVAACRVTTAFSGRTVRGRLFAGLASLLVAGTFFNAAAAHSIDDAKPALTPPMRFEADRVEQLRGKFGDRAKAVRGLVSTQRLWVGRDKITVCFQDDRPDLITFFRNQIEAWLRGTSLRIQYVGSAGTEICSILGNADIRISFEHEGHWSYVGTDSNHPAVRDKVSLNVQSRGKSLSQWDREDLRRVILHEFGHALGLDHEHQSPAARCEEEFDWTYVYKWGASIGWDAEKTRLAMETIVTGDRYRVTPYDKASIMHYALPARMFKRGKQARCFVERQATTLSAQDITTIQAAYPTAVALQDQELQRRASAAAAAMKELSLSGEELKAVGGLIAENVRGFGRHVRLEYAVRTVSATRSLETPQLAPCSGDALTLSHAPAVSCGIASDSSGLVIEVKP